MALRSQGKLQSADWRIVSEVIEQDPDCSSEQQLEIDGRTENGANSESEMEHEENDGTQGEEEKDPEMEALEKEYSDIRRRERDLLERLAHHKDEDSYKGQAVKNQKALWDKTLELRFLLHKAFSSSNKLPQKPIRSAFCNSDEAVEYAYLDLIQSSESTLNCLLELQEVILEKNTHTVQLRDDRSVCDVPDVENDEAWSRISQLHSRIVPFRNGSVDKWQRKTLVATGTAAFKGKLHAFNQNISEQVAAYMRDPSKMITGMQLRRSSVEIFGDVAQETKNLESDGDHGDPELFDDTDFYQQLLKEFFESCEFSPSEGDLYALKRQHTRKRKAVDRRASKCRKIRYNVHEKIVNFMAPEPMVIPSMASVLFENLFGQKKKCMPV